MRTHMRFAAFLAAITLTIAGCGSSDDDQAVSPDVAAVPTSAVGEDDDALPATEADEEATPAPEPERTPSDDPDDPDGPAELELPTSQRGNLIKEIDETAAVYNEDAGPDAPWLEFKITDIEVGGECTGDYIDSPDNGHFLIITLIASTGTEWSEDLQGMGVDFTAYDFSVIGADGVTENDVVGTSYSCLASSDEMPSVGQGENATGRVALDVKSATGTLVYKPWFMYEGGWEWEF